MSVEDQSQVKQENQHANIRVSPLPPAVSPTTSLPSVEELPGSNSPVLATMTPVSVDDFPAEYQHQEAHPHQDDGGVLNNKQQVIYVSSGPGNAPTILYDPHHGADSLIQEAITTSNGPVSVVQVPSSLGNNGVCQGTSPATVLVFQEFVDATDMPTTIALK